MTENSSDDENESSHHLDDDNVMAGAASPEVPSPTKRARTEMEFEVSDMLGEIMMDDEEDDNGESRKRYSGGVSYATICCLEIDKFCRSTTAGLKMYYVNKAGKKVAQDPLLSWWKGKASEFPNIWRLALKYLAMPATAASSERAFSIAGLIITPKQSSFDPSTVSNLHFLRENWGSIF